MKIVYYIGLYIVLSSCNTKNSVPKEVSEYLKETPRWRQFVTGAWLGLSKSGKTASCYGFVGQINKLTCTKTNEMSF